MRNSETVELSVDKETALERITASVDHVRTTREPSRIVITSQTGITLAYLSDHPSPEPPRGSTLTYRTGPTLPLGLSTFVSKARRIRETVAPYEQ